MCGLGNGVPTSTLLSFLMEEGADPNIKDHLGLPPLMATPATRNFILSVDWYP
jgi:hypothetical protein